MIASRSSAADPAGACERQARARRRAPRCASTSSGGTRSSAAREVARRTRARSRPPRRAGARGPVAVSSAWRDGVAVVEDGPHTGALVARRPRRTRALISTQRAITSASTSGSRATSAPTCADTKSSPMSAYLATSPRPQRYSRSGSVAQHQRVREHADAAGGTRPRGSCPRAGSRRSCRRSRCRPSRAAWWAPARRRRRGSRPRPRSPAVSPTTPPPTATTTSPRSRPNCANSPAELLDGRERLGVFALTHHERRVRHRRVVELHAHERAARAGRRPAA